jgi:hypothetical protein
MVSIPIPENRLHSVRTCFEDLGSEDGPPLPKSLCSSSGRPFHLTGQVHLDPDIRPGLRPKFASMESAKMSLYGQDNGSQTHLEKNGVNEGDLFLFFGLFRDATLQDNCACFIRSAKLKHVLWGWLQVGHRYILSGRTVPEELQCAGHHPHLDYLDRNNNCIYVGAKNLSFSPHLNGAGVFEKYNDVLCLTSRGEDRCSYWTLPSFFAEAGMTFHRLDTWCRQGGNISGKSVGRGQEFVINTSGFERETKTWLDKIFKQAKMRNDA